MAKTYFEINKYAAGQIQSRQEAVIEEEPLEILLQQFVDGQSKLLPLSSTMRTSGDDINLVKGWLFCSAAVHPTQIHSIQYTGKSRLTQTSGNQVLVVLKPGSEVDLERLSRIEPGNSSCGVCGQQVIDTLMKQQAELTGHLKVSLSELLSLPQTLSAQQILFAQTGGNHAAALFDKDASIIDIREDVGRHNAMDKLVGANLTRLQQPNTYYGVLLSGRASFELVQKAAAANISMVVALGAPSSLAIELAVETGICLLGFVSSARANIYTFEERVLSE